MAAHALDVVASPTMEESTATDQNQKIETLAYQLWLERGCPNGSDQEDWFRAETMMKTRSEEAVEEFQRK